MEKIDPFDKTIYKDYKKEKKLSGKKTSTVKPFSGLIREIQESEEPTGGGLMYSESSVEDSDLEQLLDNLHEQGEHLKEEPTFRNIKSYKEAVKDFLAQVVKKTYSLEENVSGVNILKRKRLTLITVIDQKLERLAAGIMVNQKEQLELLRRIDEIQGLLVDLLQ